MLVDALDSVLEQTYKDIELIVIDDGSADNTAEIIKRYGNDIFYEYQENAGPGAARNRGATICNGTYLTFLDSDDMWLKDKLKIQMETMSANPDLNICYTDETWIRNGVRVNPGKVHAKYSGFIFQKCVPLCIISPSSVMIRKTLFAEIGGFDESLPVCEDYDLWLRISAANRIEFIDKRLIVKRGGHDDQLSRKLWGMDRYRVIALEKAINELRLSEGDENAAVAMLRKKCAILANGFFKRGKYEEAATYRRLMKRYIQKK
jgi:glycosyltransferase involved in cell wall biosynthesis